MEKLEKIMLGIFPTLCVLLQHGASGADTDGVSLSVMEGDSVTLPSDVKINQKDRIRWYFKDTRIAQINGDLSYICTDVQCNEGTERFRDRLKLDHQTGSLTITNINTTDSGEYTQQIISRKSDSIKSFSVSVIDAGAEIKELKAMSTVEGQSVTLDPGVGRNPKDVMSWYFNDVLMVETTGDQSQICTEDQCKERFRDRLKLDHQTGSLTITHTRTTDSGDYKLQIIINDSSFSITRVKRFSVSVTRTCVCVDVGVGVGVVVGVLLVAVIAAVIYYCHRKIYTPAAQNEGNDDDNPPSDPAAIPLRDMRES